jgi:hypothetical protein
MLIFCESHAERHLSLAVSCEAEFRAAMKLSSRKRYRQDVPSVTKWHSIIQLLCSTWRGGGFPCPFIIKRRGWIEHYINMADQRRPHTRHGKLISKFHLTFSLFSENIAITYQGSLPTCFLPSVFFSFFLSFWKKGLGRKLYASPPDAVAESMGQSRYY